MLGKAIFEITANFCNIGIYSIVSLFFSSFGLEVSFVSEVPRKAELNSVSSTSGGHRKLFSFFSSSNCLN